MARYFELQGGQVGLAWIWNIDKPVGPGCDNRKDDVLLIQHALNGILANVAIKDASGKNWVGYLPRTGLLDDRTKAAILAYQTSLKTLRGKHVTVDGRIDPSNRSGWTTRTNDQYTIVYINRDYRDVHGKMMDENDFPEAVKAALKANRSI